MVRNIQKYIKEQLPIAQKALAQAKSALREEYPAITESESLIKAFARIPRRQRHGKLIGEAESAWQSVLRRRRIPDHGWSWAIPGKTGARQ
jgi:transcriptional regulator with AAA-type ATPase domain